MDRMNDIDGSLFDCITGNIALLLACAGVDDVYAPFAQDWRLELADPAAGRPAFDLPPADRDERVAERTGLRPVWRSAIDPSEAIAAWSANHRAGRPVLVVADAHALPWVPYAGHVHMDHGFVVTGVSSGGRLLAIADPYDNITEWGAARPTTTTVDLAELRSAWPEEIRWAVLEPAVPGKTPDPLARIAANAEGVRAAVEAGVVDAFVAGHAELDAASVEHLALQTWLVARSRRLHHRWLGQISSASGGTGLEAAAARFGAEVVSGWDLAAQAVYLASRRVRSGRAAPPAVLDRVTAAGVAEYAVATDLTAAVALTDPAYFDLVSTTGRRRS